MDKNISEIKYLSVANSKIYKVTDIDFCNQTIEAARTDLSIADILESEIFPVEDFREFRIRLINGDGDCGGIGEGFGDVVDFVEWIRTHNM